MRSDARVSALAIARKAPPQRLEQTLRERCSVTGQPIRIATGGEVDEVQ